MRRWNAPLVVYVHTPKTAGSTVNATLARIGKGEDHVEKYNAAPERLVDLARSREWISGHVPLNAFNERLSGLGRQVRYFSSMRDPLRQVRSHYNWLIEIYHRSAEFYENHSVQAKKISEAVRGTNNEDPDAIIATLEKHKGLFLNFQWGFVLGRDFDWTTKDFPAVLQKYTYVATDQTLPRMFDIIKPGLLPDGRKNESTYHFDPKIFENGRLKEYIYESNRRDRLCYEAVQNMFK